MVNLILQKNMRTCQMAIKIMTKEEAKFGLVGKESRKNDIFLEKNLEMGRIRSSLLAIIAGSNDTSHYSLVRTRAD